MSHTYITLQRILNCRRSGNLPPIISRPHPLFHTSHTKNKTYGRNTRLVEIKTSPRISLDLDTDLQNWSLGLDCILQCRNTGLDLDSTQESRFRLDLESVINWTWPTWV